MSAPDRSCFERVEKPEGLGQFMLAGDLVNRGSEFIAGLGVTSDYIRGLRPCWEEEIVDFLRERFPEYRLMKFLPLGVNERLVKSTVAWSGQNGLLYQKSDFYRVTLETTGDKYQSQGRFKIKDTGVPSVNKTNNQIGYAATNRNGSIEIELKGQRDSKGQDWWKGRVEQTGDKPGLLVQAVRDWVAEKIAEDTYPIFRNTLWLPGESSLNQEPPQAEALPE